MATLVANTSKAEKITLEHDAARADTPRAIVDDGAFLHNEMFKVPSLEQSGA
jgi:hypothetical protein